MCYRPLEIGRYVSQESGDSIYYGWIIGVLTRRDGTVLYVVEDAKSRIHLGMRHHLEEADAMEPKE